MTDQTPMPDAFQQATINQLTGVLKLLLMSLGTYLVQKGILDAQYMPEIMAGIAALLGSLAWMLWARRRDAMVKATSKLEGVGAVVMTSPEAAAKIPVSNVVSSLAEASRIPGVSAH